MQQKIWRSSLLQLKCSSSMANCWFKCVEVFLNRSFLVSKWFLLCADLLVWDKYQLQLLCQQPPAHGLTGDRNPENHFPLHSLDRFCTCLYSVKNLICLKIVNMYCKQSYATNACCFCFACLFVCLFYPTCYSKSDIVLMPQDCFWNVFQVNGANKPTDKHSCRYHHN